MEVKKAIEGGRLRILAEVQDGGKKGERKKRRDERGNGMGGVELRG